jgi:hypothetical protein
VLIIASCVWAARAILIFGLACSVLAPPGCPWLLVVASSVLAAVRTGALRLKSRQLPKIQQNSAVKNPSLLHSPSFCISCARGFFFFFFCIIYMIRALRWRRIKSRSPGAYCVMSPSLYLFLTVLYSPPVFHGLRLGFHLALFYECTRALCPC